MTNTDGTRPGNNMLPVAMGCRLIAGSPQTFADGHSGNGELEIPRLHLVTTQAQPNGYGGNDPTDDYRCSQLGELPITGKVVTVMTKCAISARVRSSCRPRPSASRRFHQNMLVVLKELVQAAGLADPSLITAARIVRRSAEQSVKLLANLLPFVAPGEWLRGEMSQQVVRMYWPMAQAQSFSVGRSLARSSSGGAAQAGAIVSMKLCRAASLSASRTRFACFARHAICGKRKSR